MKKVCFLTLICVGLIYSMNLFSMGLVSEPSLDLSPSSFIESLDTFCDEAALNEYALKQGYGFKTSNLKQLETLSKILYPYLHKKPNMSRELYKAKFNGYVPYEVSVPSFVGVSSNQILNYLQRKQFYELNRVWELQVYQLRRFTWNNSEDISGGYESDIDWGVINLALVEQEFYPKLFALGGRQEKVLGDQYGQYKVPTGIYAHFRTNEPRFCFSNLDAAFGVDSVQQSLNKLIVTAQGFQYDPAQEDFKARWIKESGEPGDFIKIAVPHNLIIRSTGREDTKETANAGGNESVLNVNPADPKAIWDAIAIVVASYFNEKSFMQRLNAHDKQIFDEAFVPVLFQIMICEEKSKTTGGYLGKLKGVLPEELIRQVTGISGTKIDVKQPIGKLFVDLLKIPSCGVIYTEEQEGGLARSGLKNPDGSEATTKLTVINASRGLNEGVVNSRVPVDTYYVGSDYSIHSVIRPKTKRLVPKLDGKKGSDEIDNPEPLVNTPALDQNAVFTLKFISDAIEKFYKQPMDVEFVVDNYKGIIYIVQARPFQSIGAGEEPSYLKNVESYQGRINGEILLAGDGAVKLVSSPDEIIIEKDITAALDRYNAEKNSAKKAAIKCIVIGQPAPVTSHEAATFRSYKKPVLIVPEFAKVSSLVDSGQKVVVDLQQAVVVPWTLDVVNSELKESGWVTYPIPALVSLKENTETKQIKFKGLVSKILGANEDPVFIELRQYLIGGLSEERVRQLLLSVAVSQGIEVEKEPESLKQFLPRLKGFLKVIKTSDDVNYKKISLMAIVVELITQLNTNVEAYMMSFAGGNLEHDLQNQITMLKKYLVVYAKKIKLLIEELDGFEDKRGLEARKVKQRFLYAVRCLEAIIYQQPNDKIESGYSFVNLFELLRSESKFIKKLGNAFVLRQALDKEVSGGVLSPDESWALQSIQFAKLSDHVTTPALAEKLISFVKDLPADKREDFVKMYKSLSDLGILQAWLHTVFNKNSVITQLLENFESQKNYLQDLAEKTKELDGFEVEEWLEPSKFASQYEKLVSIVNYVVGVFYRPGSGVGSFEDNAYQESGDVVTGTLGTKFLEAFSNLTTLEVRQEFIDSDPKGLSKISALNFIQFFVTYVDTAIKTLKGSDKYTLETKVGNERKMLQQSFRVLNALASIKVGETLFIDGFLGTNADDKERSGLYQTLLILRNKPYVGIRPYKLYVKPTDLLVRPDFTPGLKHCFKPDIKHINNSPGFNVSAVAIGYAGEAGFGGDVKTLEDAFTFIHQSTLNVVSLMGKYTLFSQIPRPAFLELVIAKIEEVKKIPASERCADRDVDFNKLSLIGISFIKNSLVYKLNLPLGAHGFSIELKYDVDSKKIQITCNACGPNEAGRFYKVGDFIEAVSRASGIKVDVKCQTLVVEWKWYIDENTSITYLPWYIFHGLDITMATEGSARYQSENHVEDIYKKFWGLNESIYGRAFPEITGIKPEDSMLKFKLAESIFDISLNGNRTHLALGWAIKYLRSIADSGLSTEENVQAINGFYIKITKILKRLLNELSYRLGSSFISFKRLYTLKFPKKAPSIKVGKGYDNVKLDDFRLPEEGLPQGFERTKLEPLFSGVLDDCINFPMNEILFRLCSDVLDFEKINPENIQWETWREFVKLFEADPKVQAFIRALPREYMSPYDDFVSLQKIENEFLVSIEPGKLFGVVSKSKIDLLKSNVRYIFSINPYPIS